MNHTDNQLHEEQFSLDEYIKKSMGEFNRLVEEKHNYFYDVIKFYDGNIQRLSAAFSNEQSKYYDILLFSYKGNNEVSIQNLTKLMVLQDKGASRDLLYLAAKSEECYEYISFALDNNLEGNEIKILIDKLSKGEISELEFYQNIVQEREGDSKSSRISKRDVEDLPVTTNTLPKTEVHESNTHPLSPEIIKEKVNKIKQEHGVSNKLARLIYNNKVTDEFSIALLKKMEADKISYDVLKKIIRGNRDASMHAYSKDMSDFHSAEFDAYSRVEHSHLFGKKEKITIDDLSDILSTTLEREHEEIISNLSSIDGDAFKRTVDILTLAKKRVSYGLLDLVFEGQLNAKDAYLLHIYKANKKDVLDISNRINNGELLSEDIYTFLMEKQEQENIELINTEEPLLQEAIATPQEEVSMLTEQLAGTSDKAMASVQSATLSDKIIAPSAIFHYLV